MKRKRILPFGAMVADDGVRFRLWAPAAKSIDVIIDGAPEPMLRTGSGFFELVTQRARAGTRYRYRIDGELEVPDPASRFNADDVAGPSVVVDAEAFDWPDAAWRGRPWHEAVIYELHVGTFTPQGTFAAAIERLPWLAALGITAVELMPVADFPGRRGWGYDGVLWFAPDSAYGTPDDLKRLVAAAHAHGLMIFLDVVYNHFGPQGNYLARYAPSFFTERHQTPWGAAIDYSQREVREFAIENALYWLEEFHFDGLRLDAVHAIADLSEPTSTPHFLHELAQRVAEGPGRHRHVHLVLENDDNAAHYLERDFRAQWNDDLHHAFHVLATGEGDGYYADYVRDPLSSLGRSLADGFFFQGDASEFRGGATRGEPSAHLPSTAFVSFMQNHDQIGNRAFGERLVVLAPREALQALTAIHLLAPQVPLIFMGEEFGAVTPFLYFCDFEGELGRAVTEGRRREFVRFARFADTAAANEIPDPNDAQTFEASRLDWASTDGIEQVRWREFYRDLLTLRTREIAPRLPAMRGGHRFDVLGDGGLQVRWRLGDDSVLALDAQLGARSAERELLSGRTLFELAHGSAATMRAAWSVRWTLEESNAR